MPFAPPPPLRRHSNRIGQTSPQKICGLVISDSMQLHPAALPTFVHRSSLHRNAPSLKCWRGIKKTDDAPRPVEEAACGHWRVGSGTRFLTAPHLISTAASDHIRRVIGDSTGRASQQESVRKGHWPKTKGLRVRMGRTPAEGAEDYRDGGLQIHRSCFLQLLWSVSRNILPKKLFGPQHWTYPPPWPGRKRHRVLCGRLSGSGFA